MNTSEKKNERHCKQHALHYYISNCDMHSHAVIRVIFSDTKKPQVARFDSLYIKADHVELVNVRTYVDWQTPRIEETGADMDGDVVFNPLGVVYFEAVDRIEVVRDGQLSVIFEKSVA